ncbi:MAG: InlB B-repeat-containing protein [Clostridiales Family XIII bacterium]|nr:InlB B-repeat-containing protein [Clostridiales Family XIII bacterium]
MKSVLSKRKFHPARLIAFGLALSLLIAIPAPIAGSAAAIPAAGVSSAAMRGNAAEASASNVGDKGRAGGSSGEGGGTVNDQGSTGSDTGGDATAENPSDESESALQGDDKKKDEEEGLSDTDEDVDNGIAPLSETRALASADISTMAELKTAVAAAQNGEELKLTADFAADVKKLASTLSVNDYVAVSTIAVSGNASFTINALGAGSLTGADGKPALTFASTGLGTLTLTNLGINGDGKSGGINLGVSGNFIVKDSTFENAADSEGVLRGGKNVTVTNSLFTKNKTRAINASGEKNYTIEKCSFIENIGVRDAGAVKFVRYGAGNTIHHVIRDCLFENNTASAVSSGEYIRGSAVYAAGSDMDINMTNSVFKGNKVTSALMGHRDNNRVDGGAICVVGEGGQNVKLSITDSVFEDNFAQDDGGAIIVLGAQTKTVIKSIIRNCTFTGNTVAGAQYGQSSFFVTDGSGGAINYFGMTESEITHCTFYNNGITNKKADGSDALGSVGGGGAVGVDTGEDDISKLPPCPELSNNIFVGNYTAKPASQATITLINAVTGGALGKISERSRTGNVFVLPATDRDLQGIDPRGLANNGNVGYDNGNSNYNNNGMALSGVPDSTGKLVNIPITPETVFAQTTGSGEASVPVRQYFGSGAGSSGHTAQRFCYMPSPLTDEMYRDGSGPYYVAGVRSDTRGYPRDNYPNAGAVEIYWTKFDPGHADGGKWIADKVDFNALGGIQSRLQPEIYYLITNPAPDDKLITFPRRTFELGDTVHNSPADWYLDYGFAYWESDQPKTPGGSDFEQVDPSKLVTSTKQTYTAKWFKNRFRVDFDLMYDVNGVKQWGTPLTQIPGGSLIGKPAPDPVRGGHTFEGWYKDPGYATAWDFAVDTVNVDTTLYAKWREDAVIPPPVTPPPVTPPPVTPPAPPIVIVRPPEKIIVPGPGTNQSGPPANTADKDKNPTPPASSSVQKPAKKPPTTGLDDGKSPYGHGEKSDMWALLNLLLAILTTAISIVCIIRALLYRKRDEEAEEDTGTNDEESGRKDRRLLWFITIVPAALSIIAFILTENMRLRMAFIDKWTPLMVIIFVAQLVCLILFTRLNRRENDGEDASSQA